jgi:hypothetical protein
VESKTPRDIIKHGALLHLTRYGNVVLTEPLQRRPDTTQAMRGTQPA